MTETKPPEPNTPAEPNTTSAAPVATPQPIIPTPAMPVPDTAAPPDSLSENDEQDEVTEIQSPANAAAVTITPEAAVPAPSPATLNEVNANQLLENITTPLVVELGRVSLTISRLGELKAGNIIELSRAPSDAVDLVVAGKCIGKGELVDVEGDLGVRIISLVK